MALSNGPNLGLLVDGAIGEEHYDEILYQWRGLDALVQSNVLTRNTTAPPGSPANGDKYIVPTAASGAWATHIGAITRWSSVVAAWEFYAPQEGWETFVQDEGLKVRFDGTDWVDAGSTSTGGTTGGMRYMGVLDLSTDPEYPAADKGDLYSISVRGHIGGVSGPALRFGDSVYCRTNGRPAGSHAAVGLHWVTVEGVRRGVQVLIDEATIAINCSFGTDFRVVLGGNRTLGYPSNLIDGDQIFIRVKQDATGGRTLAYAAGYKFVGGVAPVLSTAANAIDVLAGQYDAADNSIVLVANKGFA